MPLPLVGVETDPEDTKRWVKNTGADGATAPLLESASRNPFTAPADRVTAEFEATVSWYVINPAPPRRLDPVGTLER
ncbi:hypothetical protein ACHAWO_002366 [Cyclotella atomus]|uniref:Uncharacterized protein n=1 Tax=Cyclotella atomus TaxID=382360 RepID=A0ABD3PYF6_9STRA